MKIFNFKKNIIDISFIFTLYKKILNIFLFKQNNRRLKCIVMKQLKKILWNINYILVHRKNIVFIIKNSPNRIKFFFKSNSQIMKNKKNSMKYQLNMNASKNYRCHDLCETNLIFNGILILILQLFDLYGLYVLRYESLLSIFFLYTQQIE